MNASEPDRSAGGHSRTIAGLNESLAELRELRDDTRKKALTGAFVIVVLAVVITLAVAAAANAFMPFILILGIVLAVSVYVGMMHGVKLKYKNLVVPSLLKDIDPGLAYNPSGCIPKEVFRHSKIFSNTPSSYTGEDLVFGTYKGIPVRFSELKVQEKHGNGKNTTYHTFFQGVFLIADFNKDFKYSHWVLPDSA